MKHCIQNATLYTPHQIIPRGAVLLDGQHIQAVGRVDEIVVPRGVQVTDAHGGMLVPGFIDLQINGGFGFDFTADPTALWKVAAQLPRFGVTRFLPTLVTAPLEQVVAALDILAQGPPAGFRGAEPLGWHLEGPFLNPAKKGAHNLDYLRLPSLDVVDAWHPQHGVRLVTLAPELEGALDVIRALSARGVVVSAGHSLATYAQARAGLDAGITYGTHLFNAMAPLGHRQPGLPGALLTDTRATVGLIADGVHVHPAMVQLAWQVKGPERLTLVSDAMAALGMPPGSYPLGDYEVRVDETTARLADGTLAGSILTLDAALRNLIAFAHCSLEEALLTLTETPARLLGLAPLGTIAPGTRADLVLLTPDLRVAATWVGGEVVYSTL